MTIEKTIIQIILEAGNRLEKGSRNRPHISILSLHLYQCKETGDKLQRASSMQEVQRLMPDLALNCFHIKHQSAIFSIKPFYPVDSVTYALLALYFELYPHRDTYKAIPVKFKRPFKKVISELHRDLDYRLFVSNFLAVPWIKEYTTYCDMLTALLQQSPPAKLLISTPQSQASSAYPSYIPTQLSPQTFSSLPTSPWGLPLQQPLTYFSYPPMQQSPQLPSMSIAFGFPLQSPFLPAQQSAQSGPQTPITFEFPLQSAFHIPSMSTQQSSQPLSGTPGIPSSTLRSPLPKENFIQNPTEPLAITPSLTNQPSSQEPSDQKLNSSETTTNTPKTKKRKKPPKHLSAYITPLNFNFNIPESTDSGLQKKSGLTEKISSSNSSSYRVKNG